MITNLSLKKPDLTNIFVSLVLRCNIFQVFLLVFLKISIDFLSRACGAKADFVVITDRIILQVCRKLTKTKMKKRIISLKPTT